MDPVVNFGASSDTFELLLSERSIYMNIVNHLRDHLGKTPLDILVEKRMEDPSIAEYYCIFHLLRQRGAVSSSLSNAELIEKVLIFDV